MSDKIKPHHLERKAILYIRQSSAYQVSHNLGNPIKVAVQEKTRLLRLELSLLRSPLDQARAVLTYRAMCSASDTA
jgi:hypothetical protein